MAGPRPRPQQQPRTRPSRPAAPGPVLGERDAKPVLAAYGIATIAERAAPDARAAEAAAEALGYPVAMKLDAPGLAHKTELGGVRLNLGSGQAIAQAFAAMLGTATDAGVAAQGVLIQQMAAKGVEMVIGGRRDPVFGPLVLIGLGGTLVELLRDTVTAPAPVTPAQARRLLARLRHGALLEGARDLPAVDRDALALVVARVSELLADHPEITELDVNPVICRGSEITAVDALIIRGEHDGA